MVEKNNVVVYATLFGNYDVMMPALWPNSILFTDQDIEPKGWEIIKVTDKPHPSNQYASRYYFNMGGHLLPDFEYIVMHGANAQLKVNPQELIKHLGGNDFACCAHPRGSVYEEARAVVRMRKEQKEIAEQQMARYRKENYPGKGLSSLILTVKRNTPELREFEKEVWKEIQKGSHRDQLAFDYVRWKMNYPISRLPKHWNNYLRLRKHNHQGKK